MRPSMYIVQCTPLNSCLFQIFTAFGVFFSHAVSLCMYYMYKIHNTWDEICILSCPTGNTYNSDLWLIVYKYGKMWDTGHLFLAHTHLFFKLLKYMLSNSIDKKKFNGLFMSRNCLLNSLRVKAMWIPNGWADVICYRNIFRMTSS